MGTWPGQLTQGEELSPRGTSPMGSTPGPCGALARTPCPHPCLALPSPVPSTAGVDQGTRHHPSSWA